MRYRFEISERARDDADEAYARIAAYVGAEQAERWYRGLFEQIETLTTFPRRCPVAAEDDKFPEEIRDLLFGKRSGAYRIIFTIREDTVVVLRIHRAIRDEIEP